MPEKRRLHPNVRLTQNFNSSYLELSPYCTKKKLFEFGRLMKKSETTVIKNNLGLECRVTLTIQELCR